MMQRAKPARDVLSTAGVLLCIWFAAGFAAGFGASCGAGGTACRRDPVTGLEQCQYASSKPGDAAAVTGIAAGVYGFTGCTVNGCILPDRCNQQTKRCEPIRCGENKDCPAGYRCSLDTNLCR